MAPSGPSLPATASGKKLRVRRKATLKVTASDTRLLVSGSPCVLDDKDSII
jgi:hypothetical protein